MKFILEINCDNAAFEGTYQGDGPSVELARILAGIAESEGRAIRLNDEGKLRDINGNTVGFWKFVD